MKSSRKAKPPGTASPGQRLRAACRSERPLQVVGVINAYAAILAERSGFKALYISGAGVANASRGIPDIGLTTLDDVLTDVRRIASATTLPILVDADTAWGDPAKTVREMIRAGAAGIHIEDQVEAKKCGHLQGKRLVPPAEMVKRIKAAVSGRPADPQFVIMARTDAVATEGIDSAIRRACLYRDAGADMIFAEALNKPDQYQQFAKAVKVPVLANMTEFGKTPLLTTQQLRKMGVGLALYPLSAFRAMNKAALKVFREIRLRRTQAGVLNLMQTRLELYAFLGYKPT